MDSPLTPLGLEQARRNAALLRSQIGDASGLTLISSPPGRARTTAEIIGEALGLPPSFDPRLVEIELSRWDGLTVDQINMSARPVPGTARALTGSCTARLREKPMNRWWKGSRPASRN